MTDPDIVAAFPQTMQEDALAVTIGNIHGKYARANPQLDFPRLDRIRDAGVDIPLVLHGASGLTQATVREAIARGICMFDVNKQVRAVAKQAMKDGSAKGLDLLDLIKASADAMTSVMSEKINPFQAETACGKRPCVA
eukprot:gnl/TRDRNA2_/TRDRNA2_99039_c2_seq1.p1 gnl/TRDRNA2_/TRDRNA2_99039_c2~~gnl/TRDRNA2_/TRDRNA2_99039_c2_seq1.p1  ORF type:complete len:138 (+),score=20.25 gnl/TRDRNA2_/TRDRNA2_99039_c2_seq1:147-560(+)